MNNILSNCGLIDARISASEKDLPVHIEHKTSSRNLYTTIHVFLSFSHTDDNMDAKLMVIDYEFCSYNYRAFDIANHFQEWMYEYTNKSYPYYSIAKDKFPSQETRVNSIVNNYV